jgi:hypothetical protein
MLKVRLRAIICLAAFFAYILLPLAHQWHLSSHAHGFASLSEAEDQIIGTLTDQKFSQVPQESHHHHHDTSTCPLCQAALGPVKLTFTPFFAAQAVAQPGQRLCSPDPPTSLSSFHYFLFEGRAPPELPLS